LRQALGESVRLIGLGYDVWDSGLHAEGVCDSAYLMPYPSAGPAEYQARLGEIDAECGLDVFVPCLDLELPVLQASEAWLAERRIACVLPKRGALGRRAKSALPELGRAAGVRTPESTILGDASALPSVLLEFGSPLVIKGPHYDAEVVHGLDAAVSAFHRISHAWGGPILAQRFVRGEEYNVAAVRDGVSGRSSLVTMRKTVITRLGKAWAGVTIEDDAIESFSERVLDALEWHGAAEIELLKDERGELFLIEVNPRFPAWIHLSTAAGVNLPLTLVRTALGEPPEPKRTARPGVFYVRHAAETIGDMSSLAELVSSGRRGAQPRQN
jgi:carbamoyl-phosphate synthase large subunit